MVINVHNKNIISVKQIAESAFCSNGSLSSVTLVFPPESKCHQLTLTANPLTLNKIVNL